MNILEIALTLLKELRRVLIKKNNLEALEKHRENAQTVLNAKSEGEKAQASDQVLSDFHDPKL